MAKKDVLIRDDLHILGQLAVQELQRELIFQKHVATGELHDSAEYKIKNTSKGIRLEVYAEDYIKFVNDGRAAGVKRVPIAALVDWIRVKGIANDEKEVVSIAFAIQETIFRQGIPTTGGKRVASRRLKAVDIMIENVESEAEEIIRTKIQDNVRGQLDQWFRNAQKEING